MNLSEYLKQPDSMSVSELRAAIGAKSDVQIRQWQHGYGNRRPDPAYCVAIERATKGAVSRCDLRPDDWARIWPELEAKQRRAARAKDAPEPAKA